LKNQTIAALTNVELDDSAALLPEHRDEEVERVQEELADQGDLYRYTGGSNHRHIAIGN
jgi:hypothetical protein